MFQSLSIRLKRTPIFYRIAIGNAIIIIASAFIGTILTHLLTDLSATLWHFIIFVSIGVLISLVLNFIIIKLSMQPLNELRQIVNSIQEGQADAQQLSLEDTDPDIHQLAVALNSLIIQLQHRNQQLRILSERAINAQEDERKRIARSLHDDAGQALSTLVINLDRLEKQVPVDNVELISKLRSVRQMAVDSLSCLRIMIYDLRPAILDDLGLIPAIRWYAQTNLENAEIQVELVFPDQFPSLSQSLTTTLFRIAQEGVNNIVRHSQAKFVVITLGADENEVYLHIQDDGQGFTTIPSGVNSSDKDHWGLVGIQERIELVGGKMSIKTAPGQGTILSVYAPLQRTEV